MGTRRDKKGKVKGSAQGEAEKDQGEMKTMCKDRRVWYTARDAEELKTEECINVGD